MKTEPFVFTLPAHLKNGIMDKMSINVTSEQAGVITLALVSELLVEVRILSAQVATILATSALSDSTDEQTTARQEAVTEMAKEARTAAAKEIQEKIEQIKSQMVK